MVMAIPIIKVLLNGREVLAIQVPPGFEIRVLSETAPPAPAQLTSERTPVAEVPAAVDQPRLESPVEKSLPVEKSKPAEGMLSLVEVLPPPQPQAPQAPPVERKAATESLKETVESLTSRTVDDKAAAQTRTSTVKPGGETSSQIRRALESLIDYR
ncbi:MAG: hypothetical protein QXM08_03615 [Thermofilaceae archaeon]